MSINIQSAMLQVLLKSIQYQSSSTNSTSSNNYTSGGSININNAGNIGNINILGGFPSVYSQSSSNTNNLLSAFLGMQHSSRCEDEELQELLEQRDTAANADKDKSYHLQQFVVNNQGMCGMGMGMGGFNSSSAIDLTGDEITRLNEALVGDVTASSAEETEETEESSNPLVAMLLSLLGLSEHKTVKAKDTIETIDDTVETIDGLTTKNGTTVASKSLDDIAASLTKKGFKDVTKSSDGKGVEFTNKAGQKVKVFDANGDGALNKSDYNFNNALSTYKTDLTAKKTSLEAIDTKIDARQKEIKEEKIKEAKKMQTMMLFMQLFGGFQQQSSYSNNMNFGYGSGGFTNYQSQYNPYSTTSYSGFSSPQNQFSQFNMLNYSGLTNPTNQFNQYNQFNLINYN